MNAFALKKEQVFLFGKRHCLILSLLGITLTLSLSAAANVQAALYGTLRVFEFFFLGIAAADVMNRNRNLFFTYLPLILAVSVLLVSGLALLQFHLQHSVGGIGYFFGERSFSSETPGIANASLQGQLVMRPYATFPHPNVLGMYLLMGGSIIVSGLIATYKERQVRYRKLIVILEAGAVFVGTVALFLTLGRIIFLLWLLGLGLLCLYLFRYIPYKKTVAGLAVLIGVLLGAFFMPTVFSRFASLTISGEAVSDRIALAKIASDMIVTHPLTGVGLLNFLSRLPDYVGEAFYLLQPVHNIFLLVIAETGIIGGALFVSLFFACFFAIRSLYPPSLRPVCYFLLFSIVVAGLTDHYFVTLQQGQMLLTLFFAGCFAYGGKKRT